MSITQEAERVRDIFLVIVTFSSTAFLVGLLLAVLLLSVEDLFLRKQLNRILVRFWFRRKLGEHFRDVSDFYLRNQNAFTLPPRQLVGLIGSVPDASLSRMLSPIGKSLLNYETEETARPGNKPGDTLGQESSSIFIDRALDDLQASLEKNWITSRYISSFVIAAFLVVVFSASVHLGSGVYEYKNIILLLLLFGVLFAPVFRELLQRVLRRGGL